MKAPVMKAKDAPPAAREAHAAPIKRIALIEDDADIAYTIRLNLRKEKRYRSSTTSPGSPRWRPCRRNRSTSSSWT